MRFLPTRRNRSTCSTPCGVRCIELRSILKTNVLDLTDLQAKELKSLLDRHGFRLSAIGSPIGKVKIDSPFEPHLERFERAVELCKVFDTPNIRVFSYYPPGDAETWNGVSDSWEHELFHRLEEQVRLASRAGVRLVHENEHRIYGDSPDRVRRSIRGAAARRLPSGLRRGQLRFLRLRSLGGLGEDAGIHGPLPHQGLDRRRETRLFGRYEGRGASRRVSPMPSRAATTASPCWNRICSAAARPAA